MSLKIVVILGLILNLTVFITSLIIRTPVSWYILSMYSLGATLFFINELLPQLSNFLHRIIAVKQKPQKSIDKN